MTRAPLANVVYWYGRDEMPKDGGGLRAIAWYEALTSLGYSTQIYPLRSVGSGVDNMSSLRRLKKQLIPMPLEQPLGTLPDADLNVITVPSVFGAASRSLPSHSLIFDWMDLWSVNARTMGTSSLLSTLGGILQSFYWSFRQRSLARRPLLNIFAGHSDKFAVGLNDHSPSYWIPTPITATSRAIKGLPGDRFKVGFIGNFSYTPNVMSLRSFFSRYTPQISASNIEILVAGLGSEVVRTWNVPAKVLGPVESLSEFYEGIDAALVPIDHGGGIKAKAVEAMAHGVPVFGTRHVISGFAPEWAQYITPVDRLFGDSVKLGPVPSKVDFDRQFSQAAFTAAVRSVLVASGKLTNQ